MLGAYCSNQSVWTGLCEYAGSILYYTNQSVWTGLCEYAGSILFCS